MCIRESCCGWQYSETQRSLSCVLDVTAGEPFSVRQCLFANLSWVLTVDSKLLCTLQIPWAHLDTAGAA